MDAPGKIVAHGMLFAHYDQVPVAAWVWPNFTPKEMACPHCQALRLVPEAMNRLQAARWAFGAPIRVASAYRCPLHNAAVSASGREGSHTTGAAFDLYPQELNGTTLARMENALFAQGVLGRGKGLKDGRLHLHFDWDDRPPPFGLRSWAY